MRLHLRPVVIDLTLAAVLTALTVATLLSQTQTRIGWPAGVLGALTVAPIALRQRAPVATMTVMVASLATYTALGFGEFSSGGLGVLLGMFSVATLRSRVVTAVVYLLSFAALATGLLSASLTLVWYQVVELALVLLCAWVLGEGTRRWAQRAQRLAGEAARAAADERVRIARELHDIVAHHMSVVSLQAGVARYVLDTDLPTARTAIGAVGDAAREALGEMRRLLDVLRVEQAESDYTPQPGLAMLDELVNRTRGAGLPVDVTVTGRARPLPPGPDLCAYRIVQEALTNVLKHAGPATARVHLDYGEEILTVRITDDGSTPPAHNGATVAHGLRGMRERAELYGGVLVAAPKQDGGFGVTARLPIGAQP